MDIYIGTFSNSFNRNIMEHFRPESIGDFPPSQPRCCGHLPDPAKCDRSMGCGIRSRTQRHSTAIATHGRSRAKSYLVTNKHAEQSLLIYRNTSDIPETSTKFPDQSGRSNASLTGIGVDPNELITASYILMMEFCSSALGTCEARSVNKWYRKAIDGDPLVA